MNILQLEQERASLKEKLSESYSSQANLLFIYDYFEKVLSTQNKNLIESYLPEYLPEYIRYLKPWTVFGLRPRIQELLIAQAEKIEYLNLFQENNVNGITGIIEKLKSDLNELHKVLNGQSTDRFSSSKPFFPLLDEEAIKETGHSIGILESVTIKINHTQTTDKFIVVPSEKEIEEKISGQVGLSWLNATNVADRYIRKIHPHHEVIISFDKKAGFCKGNSLGAALTLAFVEEIFETYNSPLSIKVGDGIAFTGGMDERGNITNTSDEIIKQKTELIFFSDISLFIVPKKEENAANEKLNELRKEFPQRDLKIIGIEDINDLLDRRAIVEIKKQPLIIRSGKFVKKNWVGATVAIFLTIILSFLFVLDLDDNPSYVTADGQNVQIKNKNGKQLLDLSVNTGLNLITHPELIKYVAKLIDIDDDTKEIIYVSADLGMEQSNSQNNTVKCLDKDKRMLWKYTFKDNVFSKRENLQPLYNVYLIDTATVNNTKALFCFANNASSFSSAIFTLELETGERLNYTQWNSGYTWDAIIEDLGNDGKKDLIGIGADNGFNDGVIWGIEIKKLNGCRPSTADYKINNFRETELLFYIRIPKTDFDILNGSRTSGWLEGSLMYNNINKNIRFISHSAINPSKGESTPTMYYYLFDNFIDFEINLTDQFSGLRDSLVNAGVLALPYTDTKEYKELIKSNILYYKCDEWVKREYMN